MEFYKKLLEMIAGFGFSSAVNSANVASNADMHQSKEPEALLKYKSVK